MIPFAIAAALLLGLAIFIIVPPLLRAQPRTGADRQQANVAIYRDQLAELDKERAAGTLADGDYQQAKEELESRLLEEVAAPQDAPAPHSGAGRTTAIVLALVISAAALLGYALRGEPRGLDPNQVQPQASGQPQVTPEQIAGMVEKLAAHLKDNPGDQQGWVMLARSYKVMGRFPEAADAFAKAGSLVDSDPALLADYAETLARAQDGKFAGKPTQLLEKALKQNPNQPQALVLAGVAAGEREDYPAAIAYWKRLLPMVPPGSDEEKAIQDGIGRLEAKAKEGGKK